MNEASTGSLALLATSCCLLVFSIIIPRLRARWPLWVQFLSRVATLIALTVLVQQLLGSPFHPQYGSGPAEGLLWKRVLEAFWWAVVGRACVGFARMLVVLEHRPRETRIVSDLIAGSIYVATLLAIISFAFDVPIRGLLATSGVIAIVLGLALQSTLSDVFSGIAVGLERPYKPGDLLWVEGGIEGRVTQLNWRSTHVATDFGDIAIIPNSIVAKSRLVNRSEPTSVRGDEVVVSVDPGAPAETCLAVLRAAALACRIPRADPAITVTCTKLAGSGVDYTIKFYVDASAQVGLARAEILMKAQRHLRHAGIALSAPGPAAPIPVDVPTLDRLLALSDVFGVLDQGDRTLLATYFDVRSLGVGEVLIQEGEAPQALFIIASGTAEVTSTARPPGFETIYRLSPGESLGTVGLITGTPYMATVTAMTPVRAFRLSTAGIARAIAAKPELAERLEILAEHGQAALTRSAAMLDDLKSIPPETFLPKLRRFLQELTE